jgi:hypothetical protein
MSTQQAATLELLSGVARGSLEAGPSLSEQVSAFAHNLVLQALEMAGWNHPQPHVCCRRGGAPFSTRS